ncbi:hypothetical protein SDRG_16185 [Saprolegnia diclina VS20]|uniref:START domain-containing protein n=1 Tax=Saprolegnia diclina (strain VS20) TaxID=1156394 RepID=T0R927_SAPDV|nr:hypothetical protein SDRG_16185 [Saprolegnia diclina VS20]EQC25967.1 hypothetical protein SDRG_16185 [Saprolegnia diclina VS20]|eukprot:XP_008620606.1 hypothetical protein SDRG_16185 [Saprolegnia diclina VS20]
MQSSSTDDELSFATITALLAGTTDLDDMTSSSSSSSSSSPTLPARQTAKNTKQRYIRPKQELESLHAERARLVRMLNAIQARLDSVPASARRWQTRAIEQAQGVQKATQENAKLKCLLRDQRQTMAALKKLLTTPPSALPPLGVTWKQAILQHTHRMNDVNRLLQHQFDKRSSEWVRFGLYDVRDRCLEMRKAFVDPLRSSDETLSVVFLLSKTVLLPVTTVSNVLWHHKAQPTHGTALALDGSQDDDLAYHRDQVHLPARTLPPIEARTVLKRYVQDEHNVTLVWQSVASDPLYPHSTKVVGRREGWTTIDAIKGGAFVQLFVRLSLPMLLLTSETMSELGVHEVVLHTFETSCLQFCAQLDRVIRACQQQQTFEWQ